VLHVQSQTSSRSRCHAQPDHQKMANYHQTSLALACVLAGTCQAGVNMLSLLAQQAPSAVMGQPPCLAITAAIASRNCTTWHAAAMQLLSACQQAAWQGLRSFAVLHTTSKQLLSNPVVMHANSNHCRQSLQRMKRSFNPNPMHGWALRGLLNMPWYAP